MCNLHGAGKSRGKGRAANKSVRHSAACAGVVCRELGYFRCVVGRGSRADLWSAKGMHLRRGKRVTKVVSVFSFGH